jgi:hypothetical protein
MSQITGEFAYAAPAPAPRNRSAWSYFATRRFLFFSILAHVIFGILATVWIVQTIQAQRKVTFSSAPPSVNPSTRAMKAEAQMAQKRKTMSAPVQAKRIVTLATKVNVALPQMPALAMTSIVTPMRMAGMSASGLGVGSSGIGGNGPSGSGSGPQLFGFRGGRGGLVGAFYDFKQDASGNATDMAGGSPAAENAANALDAKKVKEFASNGFDDSVLSNYFRGPEPLSANQIFIPTINADLGPAAFNLQDKVKPRRWVVVYRATVTPSVSGRYHFLGAADDWIIVRFDNNIVLDGSIAAVQPSANTGRTFPFPSMTQATQSLREGKTIEVSSTSHYEMQVLIGELPGGESSAFLQIEKEGEPGAPMFPVFKLAKSETPPNGAGAPPFAPDTPWSVWRAEKPSGFSGF